MVIASIINSRGSVFPSLQLGANPPSSPTPVSYPLAFKTLFKAWNVSTPALKASLKVLNPAGIIKNSWKSTVESAWAPPLTTFIIGVGKTFAFTPPKYLYNGIP